MNMNMDNSDNKAYGHTVRSCPQAFRQRFSALGHFIHSECGIKMPVPKKVMLEARLKKRLRALGLESYEEYCDFLFSPEG